MGALNDSANGSQMANNMHVQSNQNKHGLQLDNNGQQSAVLHTSVMPFLGRYRAARAAKKSTKEEM